MSWMRLPKEHRKKDSYFAVLPIEYENSVTYGKGSINGSREIILASGHLEYYDEQFDVEAFIKGIRQEKALGLKNCTPEEMVEKVSNKILKLKERFVVSLGGDHAVTIGIIKGMEKIHKKFSVVVLDAHSDFRDSWNSSQYNHACVGKQISKKHKMLMIGLRSMDIDEKEDIGKKEDVKIIKAYEYSHEKLLEMLKKMDEKAYISIDVDVFDPCFIRNTGTPEPGGFFWDRVIDILRIVFENKKVIGLDIVEFSPNENYNAEAYSLARLAYKVMCLECKNPKTI